MTLLLSVVMCVAAASAAHLKDRADENQVIIVLAQDGPSFYDPYASDDEDYPRAIPVRLLRGNAGGKWSHILKTSTDAASRASVERLELAAAAPSQLSFYHRLAILRI